MFATLDDLDNFFSDLEEENRQSWIRHYNLLLSMSLSMENWERESLEDLIRFNKCFEV